MTGPDILLGLEKLWTEGEHINANPTIRHAFHGALLLSGIGGWRPKSVTMVHYRDVQLYWVRHPKEPSRTVTVARVTIHHVKLQKDVVNRGSQKTRYATPATPRDNMLNDSQCQVYRSCSGNAAGVPASHPCLQSVCRQCVCDTFLISSRCALAAARARSGRCAADMETRCSRQQDH